MSFLSKLGDHPTNNEGLNNAIPWWVKSIIAIGVTGTVCYKVITTDFNMAFDFTSFLALALALFSVLLAALFYFKATDTSNAFYDNTYKFTQDIAHLLVKIESGFGEKLTHLDDSYRGMMTRFDNFPSSSRTETEKQIEQEQKAEEKLREDFSKIVEEMLDKTNLGNPEREEFRARLEQKEVELFEAKEELARLSNQLECSKYNNRPTEIVKFLVEAVVPHIGRVFTPAALDRAFARAYRRSGPTIRSLLNKQGLSAGSGLSDSGKKYCYKLWRSYSEAMAENQDRQE